ncbi:MAG: TonB-dependent receptor [Candidatus Omnitrophica bacterium]|nr:TonB-dependent receptor [Candidatus Omnitrophota bacterium]
MKYWVLVLSLLFVSKVYADELDLNPIVVTTPFRYEEELNKTVSQVRVITQQDIKESNANKVIDVLRTIEGITVRDILGNGTQAVVDMAGFGEQGALNVLVLVDGRRANSVDLSGMDWNQVPLDQVERIEVIQGGSIGVLYGDNASGGAINIITKKGNGKTKGTVSTEVGSYGLNKEKLSLQGGGLDNKLSYWISTGRDAANGYRHNSYDKDSDFASKVTYDLTEDLKIHFNSGFHASTYGESGAVFQDNIDKDGRRATRKANDHANNKDYYFVTGVTRDFHERGKLDTDFSYRRTVTDAYSLSSGLYTRRNQILTYGVTPKYTLAHSVFDKDNKLIAGIDFYRTFFNSDNYDIATDQGLEDLTRIHKTSIAGYVQDELSILEPLVLVSGYRYEMARYTFNYHDNSGYNPDIDDKQIPKMQTYNAGLVYTYAPDSNVFLNASKTFRFVEVDEFTSQDENFVQQLNTSLKPQSSINYQAGIRHTFSKGFKGAVSVFRMNVHNELYLNAAGGPTGFGDNENYGHTVHEGLEASSEVKVTHWMNVWGNYTLTKAYFDGGLFKNNDIPMVPRHKASLGLRFLLPGDFTFNGIGNYVGQRSLLNDQANHYSRLNGYLTVDMNLSWTHKDWTITFGVNNVLDKQYSEVAGVLLNPSGSHPIGERFYYPSPERNYNLKVDYRF